MIFFQFILIGTCLNLCYKSVGCDNTILVSSATSLSGIVQQSKGAVTFKVVGTMLASISFFKSIMMSFEHNRLIFYINGLFPPFWSHWRIRVISIPTFPLLSVFFLDVGNLSEPRLPKYKVSWNFQTSCHKLSTKVPQIHDDIAYHSQIETEISLFESRRLP